MKVIYSCKSMLIQEFQQTVEFQSSAAMNMKMPLIQFASTVNLIQMKLMKMMYNMRNMMIQEFQHFVEFQLI
jgi:hypothetical protein